MKYFRSIALSLATGLVLLPLAGAHAQELDKKFNNWTVYTTSLQGKKTCYIASFPTKKKGNYRHRDEPYLLVTRMGNNVYEVSTSSGYPFKNGSNVNVDIDRAKYTLFTKGELAWANSSKQDIEMVRKMKKGSRLKSRGTSQIGTYSIDTYSLKGFTAAFNRMNKLCN